MNYVMIDYENVQPSLAIMASWPKDDTVKIMVFLGQAQTKARDKTRQQLGGRAEVIQIAGQGRNALDFHIAFYIGLLAAKHADAQFFVVTKDTGFDPLITYLHAQEISCQRILPGEKVQCDTPPVQAVQAPNAAQMKAVIDNLKKREKSLPKKLGTLRSAIRDVLVSEKSVDAVIHELKKRGVVKESNGKLAYKL